MFLEEVSTNVPRPVLPGLCVWSLGAMWVMTMACHAVGPRCTVMGADDVCGAAFLGSPGLGVMAASP